jgi:hypothetical protein
MSAGWKIEPKDVTAILALILSVVTFWRTVRIDKRNREIAAEQKEQENKQEALAAIGEFEKKRLELRLEIVSILIAAERRVRDLSVLLNKAKTPQVQQIISSELDGLRSLIKENKGSGKQGNISFQHPIRTTLDRTREDSWRGEESAFTFAPGRGHAREICESNRGRSGPGWMIKSSTEALA